MDTEFPGIVYNYVIDMKTHDSGYRILKMNVDNLKLIQVGLSLSNKNGEKPPNCDTWQFNLNFDVTKEKSHPDSISLLKDAGIDFDKLIEQGMDPLIFSDLLMTSGLVINPDVYWITFHGAYDFSYLLKVLINDSLPPTSEQFMNYLKHIFPNIYDIKTMINEIDQWKNYSLSKLGFDLNIKRYGHSHQAGSDSLLTLELFFKIKETSFKAGIPSKHTNKIFGLTNEGTFAHANYNNNQDVMMQNYINFNGYHQQYYDHQQFYQQNHMFDMAYYRNQQQQPQMPPFNFYPNMRNNENGPN